MRKQTKWIAVLSATALLAIGAAMTSFAAWSEEDGSWVYYDADGYQVTSTWKKSNNDWYYLDEDGYMATEKLIDDTYYVNEDGKMVTNVWVKVDNDNDSSDPEDPEGYYYYFGSNGKAYTGESGKTVFKKINGQKYAFDSDGKMMYGWIDKDGNKLTDDEGWKSAFYYCGDENDGALKTGWQQLEVINDNETKDYWFYFDDDKIVDKKNYKINGYYYCFGANGNMLSGWQNVAASGSDADYRYYGPSSSGARVSGWINKVPSKAMNEEANANDDMKWFYADSKGVLTVGKFKTINNKRYAFNDKGEMISGLVDIVASGSNIVEDVVKIEDVEQTVTGEVYYLGGDEDGAMKYASQNVTVDGENYNYYFTKDGSKKGEGMDQLYNNAIYVKGRKLVASTDLRYESFTYKESEYLVNTSGTIMKNKANLKDLDENYWCTDKDGKVICGPDVTGCTKDSNGKCNTKECDHHK